MHCRSSEQNFLLNKAHDNWSVGVSINQLYMTGLVDADDVAIRDVWSPDGIEPHPCQSTPDASSPAWTTTGTCGLSL